MLEWICIIMAFIASSAPLQSSGDLFQAGLSKTPPASTELKKVPKKKKVVKRPKSGKKKASEALKIQNQKKLLPWS